MVIVKLHFDRGSLFIICLYNPSGSGVPTYSLYNEALMKALNFLDLDSTDELWVFGDFNFPKVDWIPQSNSDDEINAMETF